MSKMVDEPLITPVRLREADPSHDFYIYHLLDEGGTPFYIGCTKHPGRYAAHLKFARKELARNIQVEKNEIIVRMLDAGLEPGFRKIAEGLSQDEGHALERAEIGSQTIMTGATCIAAITARPQPRLARWPLEPRRMLAGGRKPPGSKQSGQPTRH
jgi:hypothetical protein